jgi:hypothetical protein
MGQSLEQIKQIALKYKTRGEFQKGNRSAYIAAWRMKALDDVCSHMDKIYESWTTESLYKEAEKYGTRMEFKKGSPSAYCIALKRKDFESICSHMVPTLVSWTDKMLHSEALKYKTRNEFQKSSRSAYASAWNRGLLDKICSHMPIPSNAPYTIEELIEEALKYRTRSEFENGSCGAYNVALKRKILDNICPHMKASGASSVQERELLGIIRKLYPNAKKFRDMKVKIDNKPYIKGFDIDILVGNLGIEFDGKYHHSFEFMRKDPKKSKWSDDDIKNYDKLKDEWFLTKGIKILHIKETDWNLDKNSCIQRCINFLGG